MSTIECPEGRRPGAGRRIHQVRAGVGFLVLAMLLTPAVDGVAKTLSDSHTPMTIAFVRYLVAGLVALAVARGCGRRIVVPRGDRVGQLVRTALIMGAMTALITALGMVPMAKAVGGFLIAPIVSSLLGILVWREPPTAPRLAGAALSCLGAAILLRPEAALEPGCLFALIGGALLGTYLAAQRGAGAQTDVLSTLAVQSLLGAGLLAPFALAGGLPALTPELAIGAIALGTISAACHLLTVAAYRRADATVLAPFLYFNLLTALAVGFLWFGETLTASSLAGVLAIAAGGLLTLLDPERMSALARVAAGAAGARVPRVTPHPIRA
jgi:drug/metabolite transporter (DMT)-like permease